MSKPVVGGVRVAGEPSDIGSSYWLAQTRRHLAPLIFITTIFEALAAIGALINVYPTWLVWPSLVGIPLASIVVHQRAQVKSLEKLISDFCYFDRTYKKFFSQWTLYDSPMSGYWGGLHHAEREFIANAAIPRWTWNITKRSDQEIPFSVVPPVLLKSEATRSGSGECTFAPLRKQGTELVVDVEFEPPLRVGERVELEFDLQVPVYKSATLNLLRQRPQSAYPTPGEADFTSTDIAYPIKHFVKKVIIPKSLGTSKHGIQVLRRNDPFHAESSLVGEKNLFSVTSSAVDGRPAWILELMRELPPIKANYRIHWTPPLRDSELPRL